MSDGGAEAENLEARIKRNLSKFASLAKETGEEIDIDSPEWIRNARQQAIVADLYGLWWQEFFERADEEEKHVVADVWDLISEALKTVARPDRQSRISQWTLAFLNFVMLIKWDRASDQSKGSDNAGAKLRQIGALVSELKRQIDDLPKDAIEALEKVDEVNEIDSISIAEGKMELPDRDRLDLDTSINWLTYELPLGSFEQARSHQDVIKFARRIPRVKELSKALPRLSMALEKAVQHLAANPTKGGRPIKRREGIVTELAANAYKDLSGLKVTGTTKPRYAGYANERKDDFIVIAFSEFLKVLFPSIGLKDTGHVSQTRSLLQRRRRRGQQERVR